MTVSGEGMTLRRGLDADHEEKSSKGRVLESF